MQKCPHCGKKFEPKRKDQIYCSSKCRNLAYKKRKYRKEHLQVKECPVCGSKFATVSKRQIYCSVKCRNKANREKFKEKHKEELKEKIGIWKTKNREKLHEYYSKRAKREDVKFKKAVDFYKLQEETLRASVRANKYYKPYTDSEDDFILQMWDKMTKREIAKALNRTYASVCSRYKKLKKKGY
jgi:predicted nucleic acid-binding Zn ribbon protein